MNGNRKVSIREKKRKLIDLKNSKGALVLSVGLFLVFGLACFVVGFGLTKGWAWVGNWFVSDYASIVYVALVLWFFIVIWLIHMDKVNKNGR